MTGTVEHLAPPAVPGLYNFRSAAAWPAANGTIITDRLFRSDSPARLESSAAGQLNGLGITLVIDLRSEHEVAESSYRPPGITRIGIPIDVLEPGAALPPEATLERLYGQMLDRHGASFAAAVRTIAAHDGGAVLVHCTAGKDRTGITVALTLLALGVDRATVVADYASTHENLRGAWTEAFLAASTRIHPPIDERTVEILNGSPAALLERTLDRIEDTHGGAAGYLRAHGVTDAELEALRSRLVTTT